MHTLIGHAQSLGRLKAMATVARRECMYVQGHLYGCWDKSVDQRRGINVQTIGQEFVINECDKRSQIKKEHAEPYSGQVGREGKLRCARPAVRGKRSFM